jgi:iron transport multicopper oxidase
MIQELRGMLDDGKDLGIPDGILINAKGPYRYDTTLVPEGLQYEIVGVEPGNQCLITYKNPSKSSSTFSHFIYYYLLQI